MEIKKHFKKCIWHWGVLLFIGGLLAACNPEIVDLPRAWIDLPIPGGRIHEGQLVEVQAHAYAPEGVAEVLFSVNGVPFRREPPQSPGEKFSPVVQQWRPNAPGDYYLQIEVFDSQGEGSLPSGVWVNVIAVEKGEIRESSATASLTSAASMTPTQLMIQPADTASPTPSSTSISVPPTSTTSPLPPATPTRIPPTNTPEPTTETSPPVIGNISESSDPIFKPFCEPNTLVISAPVSDPSGISDVELVYRVVEGARQGQWRTIGMNLVGADVYHVILDWDDLQDSLDPPVVSQAKIEYYVQAWDVHNNHSRSNMYNTTLENCLV